MMLKIEIILKDLQIFVNIYFQDLSQLFVLLSNQFNVVQITYYLEFLLIKPISF